MKGRPGLPQTGIIRVIAPCCAAPRPAGPCRKEEMDKFGLSTSEWQHLSHDSLDLLRRLLRIDTSNPPGNETACAVLLRDYLQAAGVPAQLVGEFLP